MTNKDALIATVGFKADNNAIEKALLDNNVFWADDYVSENIEAVDKASIQVIEMLLSTPDVSNQDGNSIRFDRNALLQRLEMLKGRYSLEIAGRPTIKDISSMW